MDILLTVLSISSISTILAIIIVIAEKYLNNYGDCEIDINNGSRNVIVEGGDTLLSSLGENKIFIPSACGGKGTCGHCKVTVIAGGGPVLPTETPLLTRKEIRSGVRLACQLKIREDIHLRMPEELLNVRMFASRVESIVDLTHDIKQMRLSLLEPSEISQCKSTIDSSKDLFGASRAIIAASFELVEAYDTEIGPLWVSGSPIENFKREGYRTRYKYQELVSF